MLWQMVKCGMLKPGNQTENGNGNEVLLTAVGQLMFKNAGR